MYQYIINDKQFAECNKQDKKRKEKLYKGDFLHSGLNSRQYFFTKYLRNTF